MSDNYTPIERRLDRLYSQIWWWPAETMNETRAEVDKATAMYGATAAERYRMHSDVVDLFRLEGEPTETQKAMAAEFIESQNLERPHIWPAQIHPGSGMPMANTGCILPTTQITTPKWSNL